MVLNCFQCILPGFRRFEDEDAAPEAKSVEETEALLGARDLEVAAEAVKGGTHKAGVAGNLMGHCNRGLDIFKGVLVIFMTLAHVDLTLMNPALAVGTAFPHFVGNAASGMCFLGFMLAYGFSCDNAYLSDSKVRTTFQRLERVARSAMLPVCGAWVCSMAWGYMCWKIPMNMDGLIQILDFRMSMGNGPDFLLCFTFCLLSMYPLRHLINSEFAHPSVWRRAGCAAALLLVPLALTQFWIVDCTGNRKYLGYLFECTYREAYAPVLPALPHLFYFNMGVLASRYMRYIGAELKSGRDVNLKALAAQASGVLASFLVMSYPLYTVWAANYGNLMVPTKWGMVTRGFTDGPSPLWLVGNLFVVAVLLAACVGMLLLGQVESLWFCPLRLLLSELEHYGANVLMYLVVGDICLAGMWRGMMGQYPLDTNGCITVMCGVLLVTRFVHYLGASSRNTGGAPSAG